MSNKAKFEDVKALRMTDKALQCLIDGEEHWVPLSQLDDDSEVYDDTLNSMGTLIISTWMADKLGLI